MRRRNILFLEVDRRGFKLSLLDDHGFAALAGMKRDRVAATALSNGLWVHRRSTVFADESLVSLVVADRTANLAGIQHGRDLAIRFLIEKEPNFSSIQFHGITMQIAISNL